MNLNYEKIKSKVEHGGNQWTSYSDLFLVLSVVFLLLFVVANLRSGTVGVAQMSEMQQAKAEAESLRKQIKAYEVLREDYLKQGASQEEIQVYQELMGKLSLLEGEAKSERKELFQKAQEAQDKERQLNEYQAMVKNIISANLVAQQRVKKRENIISEKEQVITEKEQVIEEKQTVIAQKERALDDLNRTVQSKQAEIAANNEKIGEIQSKLDKRIKQVREAWRSQHKSEKKMQEQISKIRLESEQQIGSLKGENTKYVSQLQAAQGKIEEQNRSAERLLRELSAQETKYKETAAELSRAHQAAEAREKKAFEQGIARERLSAEAKLAREREYRGEVEKRNQLYNQKLAALNGELENTRGSIKSMEGKYQESMNALKRSNDTLARNLSASNEKLQEQRRLAERIKNNFQKAGISADVDLKTGDVMIQFANEYFESGSSDLKPGMRNTLERMIPVYAKSLLQDPKVAERINSVEVVGFASPTYQGKYVNPDSLNPEDRTAVNYNMDLSYQRAKAIFEHIFDTKKMNFPDQKRLLPLVKVSGRSYLATDKVAGKDGRSLSSGQTGYCSQFDCKKTQRVIIKFNLRDE